MNITLSRRILALFVLISLALAAVNVIRQMMQLSPGFSDYYNLTWLITVGRISSFPTWWVTMLLLLGAGAALLNCLVIPPHPSPLKGREQAGGVYWAVLAGILLLLSINETIAFHSRLISRLKAALGDAYQWWLWLIPVFVLLIVLAIVYRRFLAQAPRLFVVGLTVYLVGLVGVKLITESYVGRDVTYEGIHSIEEGAEMIGAALMLYAMTQKLSGVKLRIGGERLIAFEQPPTPTVFISPTKITALLAALIVGLLVINVVNKLNDPTIDVWNSTKYSMALDTNFEASVPTWLSSALFVSAAGLSLLIAAETGTNIGYWRGLAAIFTFLSIDEMTSLHERLIDPMRDFLGTTSGPLYYAWIVPGAAFVFVIALVYLGFWLHLPPRTRILFVVAGVLFLGGVVVMEAIGGNYVSLYTDQDVTYALMAVFEEALEFAGVLVFVYALLDYARVPSRVLVRQAAS